MRAKSWKQVTVWLMILVSAYTLSACGKKDDKKSTVVVAPQPQYPNGWNSNCLQTNTCINNPGFLGIFNSETAIVAIGAQLQIQMQLLGQQQAGMVQDPKLITYYSGTVTAVGQMNVIGANGSCGLLAGTYQINTIRPGNAVMATVQNLQVEAVGPVRVLMTVAQGIIYNDQDPNGTNSTSSTNRLGGTLIVENINGQPTCQGYLEMF